MQLTRHIVTKVIPIAVTCCLGVASAQRSSDRLVTEDGPARQRRSILAMQESLARQRLSARQQAGQGDGFFLLGRAESFDGTTTRAPMAPPAAECDALPKAQVESLIRPAARRQGLDAELLRRVMRQESGFRPCAISSRGASGLMQLMPSTLQQFGIADPFNPAVNVDAGAKLLKQLLTRYNGDLAKTLAAYNAGPAKVDAADGIPAIPETLDYVRQILSILPLGR
jgi:soluble lytic murein transglycosylase-like protein